MLLVVGLVCVLAALLLVLHPAQSPRSGAAVDTGRDSTADVILKLAKPQYPAALLSRSLDGRVVVQVQVASAGSVHAVTVVRSSGVAEFDAAALDAARGSRFAARAERGRGQRYLVALAYEFDGREARAWVSSLRQSEAMLGLRPDTVPTIAAGDCDEPPALEEPALAGRPALAAATVAMVMVEADGTAGRIELAGSDSNPAQDSAVRQWLRAARYRPASHAGRPARSWLRVELPGE